MQSTRKPYLSDDDHYIKYGGDIRQSQTEPLISKVTNKWREEEGYKEKPVDVSEYPPCCEIDDEDECLVAIHNAVRSRRFRRVMFLLLLLFIGLFCAWKYHYRTIWQDNDLYLPGLNKHMGAFGVQMPDKFTDVTMVKDLEPQLMPGGDYDRKGRRRLVFIGDIHGCREELDQLLEKVHFDADTDHLIATGDMIAKGPDNVGVLERLMGLRASAVRGNNEDRVLLRADAFYHIQSVTSRSPRSDTDKILASLDSQHIEYLKSLPLILRIPKISPPSAFAPSIKLNPYFKNELRHKILNEINVVHAGLVPAVPLSRQDPYSLMNMRSIHPHSHIPSADRDPDHGWERAWNWYQERVFHGKPLPVLARLDGRDLHSSPGEEPAVQPRGYTEHSKFIEADFTRLALNELLAREREVDESWISWFKHLFFRDDSKKVTGEPRVAIYGHDSKRGLNLQRWSKGLDSACVSGGSLTALTIDAYGHQDLVQVDCSERA